MARQTQTQIESAIAVDDPLRQDSEYRFDPADRQYIDSQVRGCERHLVDSLLSGMVCTWQEVDSTSAALAVGDAAVPTTSGKVSKATAALLAAAGSAYGIAVTTGVPGGKVRLAIGGRVPRTVTGLAAAAAGFARVNTTTARLEKVAAYAGTDWPAGIIDTAGTLAVTLPLAQGGAVAGTSVAAGFSNELYVDIGGNNTTAVRGSAARPFRTFTAALAAAQSGDVVRGGPGTWVEDITLPELAEISIIGSGMDRTWIQGVANDATIQGAPTTTELETCTIAGLTVYNPGVGTGYAIDIVGSNLATPGNFISASVGLVLKDVRTITDGSVGNRIRCAGIVDVAPDCMLDGLSLRAVAQSRLAGTIAYDSAAGVAWDPADTLPTGYTTCTATLLGCFANGFVQSKLAVVTANGGSLDAVTVASTDSGGAQGTFTASNCSIAAVTASGTAVVAGDIVALDACKVGTMTVTKTGAAGTRVTASAKGGTIASTVSAGDKCDLDIRGSYFDQYSLARVGDGTIERSTHRGSISLINGDTNVTLGVPFFSPNYSVAYEITVAASPITPTAQKTSTGFRATSTAIDAGASFMILHD